MPLIDVRSIAPQGCCMATVMFSTSVRFANTRACWNVRHRPSRYSRAGSGRLTRFPSSANVPESAGR